MEKMNLKYIISLFLFISVTFAYTCEEVNELLQQESYDTKYMSCEENHGKVSKL